MATPSVDVPVRVLNGTETQRLKSSVEHMHTRRSHSHFHADARTQRVTARGSVMADPMASLPICSEDFQFPCKKTGHPSEQENDEGKARENLESCDCETENHLADVESNRQANPTTALQDDEFWPLSGRPYFHCIISKSNVKPGNSLFLPTKMHSALPSAVVPVVLTRQNKKWEMLYYGDRRSKRFDPGWKNFAVDNNLNIGDACVFELMECSSKGLEFRVQILSGQIPFEFLSRINGETLKSPIMIE